MKNKWVKREGTKFVKLVDPASVTDDTFVLIQAVAAGTALAAADEKALTRRKLATKKKVT